MPEICFSPSVSPDYESANSQRCRNRADATGPRLRVDNVPGVVRPLYVAIAWILGAVLYAYYAVCRWTAKISIEGPGNRDLSQHSIFCLWHESFWSYPVVFLRYRRAHAMISHPAAYMKPMHCLLRLMGLKRLFLGSSGNEGKQAVNEVAKLLRKGWSTTIAPDGPKGPARTLKKGVLHMAAQSGVPVVPLTITSSHFIPVPSWDGKKHPMPFARIKVVVHEAVHVTHHNFNETAERIIVALGMP